jgi:hypothetical protein
VFNSGVSGSLEDEVGAESFGDLGAAVGPLTDVELLGDLLRWRSDESSESECEDEADCDLRLTRRLLSGGGKMRLLLPVVAVGGGYN